MASNDQTLRNKAQESTGGTYGDVAQQRRGTADDLRAAATAVANGDIETAKQLIMQIIAVQATATDQNFRAQLQLETVQGSIGNMLKIFGTILKGMGAEDIGQSMIDLANDPNLTLNPVSPDMRALEALENNTNLSPELRRVVTEVITDIGGTARAQAAETGSDVDDQIQRSNGIAGGAAEEAAPAVSTRETGSVARNVIDARAAEEGLGIADLRSIENAFRSADTSRNGTLETGEVPAFRTGLTTRAKTALDSLFAPAAP